MLELKRDDDENPHMIFTKNRRGQVQEKLYYSLSNSGDVDYQRGNMIFDVDGIEEVEPVEVKMDPVDISELSEVLSKLKI
jgi:hypothetical protein